MEYFEGLPAQLSSQTKADCGSGRWTGRGSGSRSWPPHAGPYRQGPTPAPRSDLCGDKTSKPGTFADALNHAAAAMERLDSPGRGAPDAGDDADFNRQRRQQIVPRKAGP